MLVKVFPTSSYSGRYGLLSPHLLWEQHSVLLRGLEHRPCLYNTLSCPKLFLTLSSQAVSHGRSLQLDGLHGNEEKKILHLERNTTGCLCCLNPDSFVSCLCWENWAGNWEAAPPRAFSTLHLLCSSHFTPSSVQPPM